LFRVRGYAGKRLPGVGALRDVGVPRNEVTGIEVVRGLGGGWVEKVSLGEEAGAAGGGHGGCREAPVLRVFGLGVRIKKERHQEMLLASSGMGISRKKNGIHFVQALRLLIELGMGSCTNSCECHLNIETGRGGWAYMPVFFFIDLSSKSRDPF